MVKKFIYSLIFLTFIFSNGQSQRVYILYDNSTPQAEYASKILKVALVENGYSILEYRGEYDYLINIDVHSFHLADEAYAIIPEGKIITINGGDERGMIYGTLSLAEDIRNGTTLKEIKAKSEKPKLPFRAIKHNLPWDVYRSNPALTLHYETVRDVKYWEAFLDMMVENRFNVITLWNLHTFTYMIKPKNFPEASPFTDEEFSEWQNLYRSIFRMAKERGIDSYIVNWNIFVSREFSTVHNVANNNFYPNFYVNGDTALIVKRYVRECVTQVLEEYPDLSGIGISHGEGMGGMTPQQRQDWIDETIIEGMKLANRTSKLIHRVPFSANLSSGGSTNKATEILTRKAMENLGDFFDGPIWVEMKFNWSHAHSTPKLIKVHGGELGDTYFKPEPKNYKITWMVRNEDFFVLRWGVPDFIRDHLSLNAKESFVGGYFVGSEGYIPAKDYFTAVKEPVNWTYAFERQWLFYKLWGRLLYNPNTKDEVFEKEFIRRYGKGADNLLKAYSLSSSTPLRLASFFDFTWDLTLYSEGFMSLNKGSMDYISVDRLINQPPADPEYVSIKDYVESQLTPNNRITPIRLASMLEEDCKEAINLVKDINVKGNATLMYEVADILTWSNLGLHLAKKIKGAVALQTYRIKGGEENKETAINFFKSALSYWDKVIEITRPIYKDMPSTPYVQNGNKLFHWQKIRNEVIQDIEIAKKSSPGKLN